MKKHRPARFLPVSQRELALYLGVSPTLLNMAESGRHGDRQLNYAASLKMTQLIQAHQQSQHSPAPSASHKKLQDRTATECVKLAKIMLQDAANADRRATRFKQRLDEMAKKEQQDMHWLKTVDRLLEALPNTKESAKDRKWLEVQQAVVFVRLRKNDRLARVKLQVQLQKETDKARAYRNLQQQLLKN